MNKKAKEGVGVPVYLENDLLKLQSIWKIDKKLNGAIFNMFSRSPNCYLYALNLMHYANDFASTRGSTMSHAVMKAFDHWLEQNPTSHPLSLEIKTEALHVVLNQRHGAIIDLVSKIYKMKEDAPYLKEVINQYLSKKKLKQACYATAALGLQHEFPIEEIILPLVFEDKMPIVKVYVNDYPEIQLALAKALDSVCGDRKGVSNMLSALNIVGCKTARNDAKWIQKLLSKFINAYNIPPEECPNLCRIRSFGAMNYLIYKRYTEGTISQDSFEELIMASAQDNHNLQRELIMKLVCMNECHTALKMAKKFGINPSEWPDALHVTEASENDQTRKFEKSSMESALAESWDEEIENSQKKEYFLDFRLKISDIHLIETTDIFIDCINDISENYTVVGVDAEWRPSMGISTETPSLLQLAVWDSVYLLDILKLSDCLSAFHWDSLMDKVFCNPELVKLGYGIKTDLQMLSKDFNGTKGKQIHYSHVLDLGMFFTELNKCHPDIMPQVRKIIGTNEENVCSDANVDDNKGLSKLCKTVLGKYLNKEEQFSDWKRRPLRKAQIVYAALDAFCLLQVYENLFHALRMMNLNMDEVIEEYLRPKSKPAKTTKAKKTKNETLTNTGLKSDNVPESSTLTTSVPKSVDDIGQKNIPNLHKEMSMPKIQGPPIPVNEFKVVVDNMLQGLGKCLRIFGADVVILENKEDHTQTIKIAQEERRYILTSGAPYLKVIGYMPQGMCFNVPQTLTAQQQAAVVLKHFNVQCTTDDVFSRCTVCNNGHYMKIYSEDMELLWTVQRTAKKSNNSSPALIPFLEFSEGYVTYDGIMHTGVPIQLSNLCPEVLLRMKFFLVCTGCGKVYWEGSHHANVKRNASNFLVKRVSLDELDHTKEQSRKHENVEVLSSNPYKLSSYPAPGPSSSYQEKVNSETTDFGQQLNSASTSSDSRSINYQNVFYHADESSDDELDDLVC